MTAKLCLHVSVHLFLLTNYRLLGDMVSHFATSQEEITLSTSSQRVSLRNYCEDGESELNKPLATATPIPAADVCV